MFKMIQYPRGHWCLPSEGKNREYTVMQLPQAYVTLKMCDRLFCLDRGWYMKLYNVSEVNMGNC